MQSTVERQPAAPLTATKLQHSTHAWICLFCGAALLLIADGRIAASLAIWAALPLLLRFLRTQPMLRGLVMIYLVRLAVFPIAFRGMVPIPVPFYYIFLVISGLFALVPFAMDRWLAPRLEGILSTLVFPTTLVMSQFLYGKGPMGSWGSLAYTQSGGLALEQLLSVTGLTGIVFLIGWFASSANWAWEGRDPRRMTAFAIVLFTVLLGGELRMSLAPPSSPTVRVASLLRDRALAHHDDAFTARIVAGRATAEEIVAFRAESAAVNTDLLRRAEREARAGARIVFWAEENAQLLKQDEPALLQALGEMARENGIYLGAALATWTPGAAKPLENKVALFGPDGQLLWQYWKVRPTPGPEMAAAISTDGRLKTLDTPYGRLSTPICYDTDFPALLMQAGRARADLVVSPANDWRAIDPRHTEIASFRAIEQGFNLVRASSGGLSAAYDYQGRRLAAVDSYHANDGTLVAELPTRGVRTLYSLFGDWLVWLSAAALAALLVMAMRTPPAPGL